MRFVLDASVAVAAARPNEPSHRASKALVTKLLGGEHQVVVPAIFPIEVGASLVRVGEHITAVRAYVDALVSAAEPTASIGPRRARMILELAMQARLRAADAAYLWLAAHESLPLYTLDRELAERGTAFCRVLEP